MESHSRFSVAAAAGGTKLYQAPGKTLTPPLIPPPHSYELFKCLSS